MTALDVTLLQGYHPLAPQGRSYGNVHGQRIKEEDVLQHFLTFDIL